MFDWLQLEGGRFPFFVFMNWQMSHSNHAKFGNQRKFAIHCPFFSFVKHQRFQKEKLEIETTKTSKLKWQN